MVEQSGFINVNIYYRHNFDLSNIIKWANDGKPTGNGKIKVFDTSINSAWKIFVETSGLALVTTTATMA